MSNQVLLLILLFSPLLGFLLNGLRYKSQNYMLAGAIATGAVFISFLAALGLVLNLTNLPEAERQIRVHLSQWVSVGSLRLPFEFVVDQISAIMILVITGVGTLIHMFSISYMSHDKRPAKYFAYLNYFVFNMLLLVLGENLIMMFFGWEGVGLASYLLIGFWFEDSAKAAAGMKAFITNRIGDAGFLLGIFFLFYQFGTLSFDSLNTQAMGLKATGFLDPMTLATLCLFIGAAGKSAQIPLYVWLPDAMAGPTPVSALIHAATMVTAGVYMICRLSFVFMATPQTMTIVAIIGALTAVMAASIGLTQWDIKKILAYSTVSQLGYMFLAVGVGAFNAAMFHLMTHAFFKALMFLGSGSVIHAMHEEQDIRKMGGLKKYMPITHLTFVAGWLAIMGTPLFSGFFSKDEILWMAWHSPMGHWGLWALGVLGAGFTAFYMTRLMALTFWGKERFDHKQVHPHESPPLMTIPLIVLGLLSVVGGLIGIPHFVAAVLPGHPTNWLEHWLDPRLAPIVGLVEGQPFMEWMGVLVSVSTALIGATLAYRFYLVRPEMPRRLATRFKSIHTAIYNKYYVDEFYFGKIIDPLIEGSRALWAYVDVNFIDKFTYWAGDLARGAGQGARSMQNGNIQQYALYIMLGVVGVMLFMLVGF